MSCFYPCSVASLLLIFAAGFISAQEQNLQSKEQVPSTQTTPERQLETAVFAGGCFWCMETAFDPVPGVVETISGYTGGKVKNPTYARVKHGGTGHYEALQVTYDPSQVTYEQLLDVFWRNIDPFNPRGQFCDLGSQYRTAVFINSEKQREIAEASYEKLSSNTRGRIATKILDLKEFYRAEEYHQDYYIKNPLQYKAYRSQCGRDHRLLEIWGAEAGGH